MYQTLLLSSSLFILHVTGTPHFFAPSGRRVCGRDLRHSVVMATESYVQPVHKPYITLCQGHRLCSTYKTTYSVAYRQVSRAVSAAHFYPECCPGWRRFHSHNCNQALCAEPCVNGGTCIRPNQCACPPGWTGHHCQTGERFGLAENVTEEVQILRNRVELLEKKLQLVLAPFNSFFPLSLDDGLSEKTTLLSHSFQQLDRIDSLSEQIGLLEERLGTCSCQEN
ncbi:epidermal growth factor-like protein 7 isoform X2 [Salarias fasciatus]|uniref:epidermal growth factor-like protein 7 isoform X2 n=1 Tax=Salarias fasciatus TaxID=181472 RepID=UPI001176F1F0|nr:epidermal growth factor-like protein 7 isoform X2 [Salarias fasciatus]